LLRHRAAAALLAREVDRARNVVMSPILIALTIHLQNAVGTGRIDSETNGIGTHLIGKENYINSVFDYRVIDPIR